MQSSCSHARWGLLAFGAAAGTSDSSYTVHVKQACDTTLTTASGQPCLCDALIGTVHGSAAGRVRARQQQPGAAASHSHPDSTSITEPSPYVEVTYSLASSFNLD